MATPATRSRRIPWRIALVAIAVVAGGIAGAAWDWINWHPMDALVLTLGAVVLLILGSILALVRRRGRTVGIVLLVLGGGIVAGQVLGPSRPPLELRSGTGTVALISPKVTEGNALVDCYTSDGSDLQMVVDQNLRLDIVDDDPDLPADIDQREFIGATLTIGDRWRDRGTARPDDVDLFVIVGFASADIPETQYTSSPSSTLEVDWSNAGGTLRFSGLQRMNGSEAAGPPLDLTGTITWTC